MKSKQKLIAKMAAFFLTFSLLFLCPSPGFGTTAAHAPTCCPAQSPINKLIHKAAIVPAFGQGLIKFLFAITFLGFVFVGKISKPHRLIPKLTFYWKDIRLRKGSSRVFELLPALFRRGLLHSKSW